MRSGLDGRWEVNAMELHDDGNRAKKRPTRRFRRARLQRILQVVAAILGGLLHLAAAVLSASGH
jgi:hypothetical protein